jgi:peptidoglycan-N-acetylglucosamine deacetylase
VISRAGWGAKESLRFDKNRKERWPRSFWPIQKIVVHHTETQNNDPDPAATVRKIYHDDAVVEGLGDISYNFLIDESGRIYEGRYSRPYGRRETPTGEDKAGNGVEGGHAAGHNPGTVGIAMIGNLTRFDATPRARAALARLVAWIAATHGLDPAGATVYRNPVSGVESTFPNVAGHRDVAGTDCPGDEFYAALPGIRSAVAGLLAGKRLPRARNPRGRRGGAKRASRAAVRERRRERRAIARLLRRRLIVTAGGGRRKEVALTFDDGPGPYTTQVVDVLARMRAPATFFAIGESIIYFSDAAVNAHDQGFAIGNLTESFLAMSHLSRRAQGRQVRAQAARVRSLGIPAPRVFRPPYGTYDRRTLDVLRKRRLLMVLWSVDTQDYKQPGVEAIVERAVRGARAGSIILMHDAGGDRSQTLAALPSIVRGLRARGYKLVTVPRLMLDDPPRA